MFHAIGKLRPHMLRFFEYRHRWWGKVRISERSDRNEIPVRPDISVPIQGCSTVGAEIESNLAACLPVSLEDLAGAFDPDLCLREGSTTTC
jgi:hypothetical protein